MRRGRSCHDWRPSAPLRSRPASVFSATPASDADERPHRRVCWLSARSGRALTRPAQRHPPPRAFAASDRWSSPARADAAAAGWMAGGAARGRGDAARASRTAAGDAGGMGAAAHRGHRAGRALHRLGSHRPRLTSRWRMNGTDLVKTGVSGLDALLNGGLPSGNIIVVEGSSGSGKTTLGLEFIYRGAAEFDEPGIIVLFEVPPVQVIRDAAQFGWDLRELERLGKIKLIFTTRSVLQQELQQADGLLLTEAAHIGAKRIFIDSMPPLPAEPNGSNGHGGHNGDGREVLHTLAQGLRRENLTAMLAVEAPRVERSHLATTPIEEFIADSVVVLSVENTHRAASRSIEVIKSRGQPFQMGCHSFRIVTGRGIEIYRRVQAPRDVQREETATYETATRVPT